MMQGLRMDDPVGCCGWETVAVFAVDAVVSGDGWMSE